MPTKTQPVMQNIHINMNPFSINNNGDLQKYWSTVQRSPWKNVTKEVKRQQKLTDKWNQFTTILPVRHKYAKNLCIVCAVMTV